MWVFLCRIKSPDNDEMNFPPENQKEYKLMFFDFTPNWDDEHPLKVLKDFNGRLQTDAYAGFKKAFKLKDIIGMACLAHCRRKFFMAAKIGMKEAESFLMLINILYRIEHRIAALKEKGFSDDYRLTLRQKRANRIMNRFFKKVKETTLLPKSPLGKALTYAINQEQELRRYVDELRFSPDNNVSENALRPLCVGRKNYMMMGSDCGGKTAATLYSLIGSCRANGINPYKYLKDVQTRISTLPYARLPELLPHNWEKLRLQK
jgi:hypothetical protein